MSTVDAPQNLPGNMPKWRGCVVAIGAVLGVFAGLCTLLVLVVTAGEAWQERAQAQWPEAAARVQRCGLDIYSRRKQTYWIDCRVSYELPGEVVVSLVHSRSIPAPGRVISQNPSRQFDTMQDWVDKHPPGTPIAVHYHPANHNNAVLVTTDMPLGGPTTPDNLKLLGVAAAICVLMLAIARIARPRPAAASVRS